MNIKIIFTMSLLSLFTLLVLFSFNAWAGCNWVLTNPVPPWGFPPQIQGSYPHCSNNQGACDASCYKYCAGGPCGVPAGFQGTYCHTISFTGYWPNFWDEKYELRCPCIDNDGDGYGNGCAKGNDCNDNNSAINPAATEICGDGIDNNCNGEIDEGCKKDKIMQYISGSPQEGKICEILQSPFVEKVVDNTGTPQKNISIIWQIKSAPASGASINPANTTTNPNGLASTTLTLGSQPGTYTVEAACPECTSGSPQTLTATAKCPDVPVYYQSDYKDAYDGICKDYENLASSGKPGVKLCADSTDETWNVSEKGCALTNAAMVMERYGGPYTPDTLNHTMTYTFKGYDLKGRVKWDAIDYITAQEIKLKEKIDGDWIKNVQQSLQTSKIDKYLEKCLPVIVKVHNWYQKKDGTWDWSEHWVVVTGKSGSTYNINDPGYKNNPRTSLSAYNNEIYAIRLYESQNGGCQ